MPSLLIILPLLLFFTFILSRISSVPFLHSKYPFKLIQFFTKTILFIAITATTSIIGILISLYCISQAKRHLSNYYTGKVYNFLCSKILFIKCKTISKQNFPSECVVIANHQSSLDLFIMSSIWPEKLVVIAKESVKFIPILGWHLWLADNIFIRRTNREKAMETMKFAANCILEKKVGVFMFPEGTRSHCDEAKLLPFKKGAFHLALQAKVPIIPVVASSYGGEVYNSKKFLFNDGVINIDILPPISTDGYTADNVGELAEKCQKVMLESLVRLKSFSE